MVEHGARLAGDAERLSTLGRNVCDVLVEADHRAGQRSAALVTSADVSDAIEAAARRTGRVRERLLEETQRGTLVVDCQGERVGQVNGLAVSSSAMRASVGRAASPPGSVWATDASSTSSARSSSAARCTRRAS